MAWSLVQSDDNAQTRPSLWPIRTERRHVAVIKIDKITERLCCIEERISQGRVVPPPGLAQASVACAHKQEESQGCQDYDDILTDTRSRLTRMETLLLRTPIPDFEQ